MANENNEALFVEGSRGSVSAITVVVFVLSLVLSMGGLVLMSYGFNLTLGSVTELWIFIAGLAASIIGFFIPFTLLPAIGK